MASEIDNVFFQACCAIRAAFPREAAIDFKFNTEFESNRNYWMHLSNGLILSTFCHLVETKYGSRNNFKNKLSKCEYKEILEILFYVRNTFIHCNWDVSKLQYDNQKNKLLNFIGEHGYRHEEIHFQLDIIDNKISSNSDFEPICRVLLNDV